MIIKGFVFSGVMRGKPLVDIYYDRLSGLIGFKPFRGTMDVKLEKEIDIKRYSDKAVENILMDGSKTVNLRLARINLTANGKTEQCWCMQQEKGIYGKDIVEIISRERLKDVMGIEDRQHVEIEFFEVPKSGKDSRILAKLKHGMTNKQGKNK